MVELGKQQEAGEMLGILANILNTTLRTDSALAPLSDCLSQAVQQVFDLRPTAIIKELDLRRPIYRQVAAYGHMGREDLGVPWEKTNRTEALLRAVENQ